MPGSDLPPVILASGSSYRAELLARLKIPFTQVVPGLDETAWKERGLRPQVLAEQLAIAKAREVAAAWPKAIVIGGDQVVSVDGTILGKPGDRETGRRQLERLAGKTHELITALAVMHEGDVRSTVDVTRLLMRPLSGEEIERYLDVDQPWDCAGTYKIESLGISLFEAIDSVDQSAITGLPLLSLCRLLRSFGLAVP